MSYTHLGNNTANQIIDNFISRLNTVHTGRVNASILDIINVEVYGSKMKIQELATINTPESNQLLITPFDKSQSMLSSISKAIQSSDIGVNPQEDSAGVRLIFPALTQEIREKRAKSVSKMLEEMKVQIRQLRKKVLTTFKNQKEQGEISEDEIKKIETELQKEVDTLNHKCQEIADKKEKELLTM